MIFGILADYLRTDGDQLVDQDEKVIFKADVRLGSARGSRPIKP